MADITIKYKGAVIAEMSESGVKTLNTSGKYCEGNIVVEYAAGAVADPTIKKWDITVSSGRPPSGSIMTLLTDEWLAANRTDASLKVIVAPKFTAGTASASQFLLYNANTPYITVGTTNYYSFARLVIGGSLTIRQRSIPLSSAVNDVGDMDITTAGALRVVASSSAPMAVGDYTVMAWIDA